MARTAAHKHFARTAAHQKTSGRLSSIVLEKLSGVLAYSFFDMSFKGDFIDIPPNDQLLSEVKVLEIEQAVAVVQGWKLRENKHWVKDISVGIVRGKKDYFDFTRGKAENSEGVEL
ncbi:hypothetical protein B0T18DRAFT_48661 [Schizothecium vesticola]|uniref:Uncharacterized protein n=1 Tax=Schizothecium vesticola TaxID=314040 RepID=A0AA40KD91_9PEZI|nr:hypothetical protein B0T18DRAFT_48661 [Schizothecium vesticola]